jgi:Flp pilus assembly protein TadD
LLAALSHSSHAQQLAGQKEWDQAQKEAYIAISLAPGSAEAHAVLGNILLAMGRTEEARRSFQDARSLAQNDHPQFQMIRVLKIPPNFSSQ